MRRSLPILVILALCMSAQTAFAQTEEGSRISISRLQSLYSQLLKAKDDTYIQKLITDERADIRKQIETELKAIVAASIKEEPVVGEEAQAIIGAVERQRTVVAALGDRLAERKADLDLLAAEEVRLYKANKPPSDSDTTRLTQSYPELLAKKALFEERISAIESLTTLQEDRLQELVNQQRLQQFGIFIGLGRYVIVLLIILFIERTIRMKIISRVKDVDKRYTITKTFTATVYSLALLWLLGALYAKNPGIAASLAIIGAGLAIALQDVVKDVVGWFMIIHNRLFIRGNRITVGTITGEVTDYGLLRTTMLEIGSPQIDNPHMVLERTGKIFSIPNATFLTQPVMNHTTTSDFVRAEMRVTITYGSDWRKARDITLDILNEETIQYLEADQRQTRHRSKQFFIPHRTMGNQVYYELVGDGIELTLRFTVPIGDRRPVVSVLSDKILEAFNKAGIELAYRTSRVYSSLVTEK
ncbi:mechanosensitive ion channel, partial [Candidatus Peregrinibacteria bacterium]|nr:mechanosensitive ion channel [Candidatus Peregrinibacteria bacterium]